MLFTPLTPFSLFTPLTPLAKKEQALVSVLLFDGKWWTWTQFPSVLYQLRNRLKPHFNKTEETKDSVLYSRVFRREGAPL
jgi:hypothetical protein